MNDQPETPTPDESLRACFIANDLIVEGLIDIMTFLTAARENGPEDWRADADIAFKKGGFVGLFLGVLQRALTDLRLVTPEDQE